MLNAITTHGDKNIQTIFESYSELYILLGVWQYLWLDWAPSYEANVAFFTPTMSHIPSGSLWAIIDLSELRVEPFMSGPVDRILFKTMLSQVQVRTRFYSNRHDVCALLTSMHKRNWLIRSREPCWRWRPTNWWSKLTQNCSKEISKSIEELSIDILDIWK